MSRAIVNSGVTTRWHQKPIGPRQSNGDSIVLTDDVVTEAAPVLGWTDGKRRQDLSAYFRRIAAAPHRGDRSG
jgi:hypothetical protein